MLWEEKNIVCEIENCKSIVWFQGHMKDIPTDGPSDLVVSQHHFIWEEKNFRAPDFISFPSLAICYTFWNTKILISDIDDL